MKIHELIAYLSRFNPYADAKMIVNGKEDDVEPAGWSDQRGDIEEKETVDVSKMHAEKVYIIPLSDKDANCERAKDEGVDY